MAIFSLCAFKKKKKKDKNIQYSTESNTNILPLSAIVDCDAPFNNCDQLDESLLMHPSDIIMKRLTALLKTSDQALHSHSRFIYPTVVCV